MALNEIVSRDIAHSMVNNNNNSCYSKDIQYKEFSCCITSVKIFFQNLINLANEKIINLGSCVYGITTMSVHSSWYDFIQYLSIILIGIYFLWYLINYKVLINVNQKNVVIITGCDSGLGFNMAIKCYQLNMTVIACCYNKQSEGTKKLLQLCPDVNRLFINELDITKNDNIVVLYNTMQDFLSNNKDYILSTLINNAGILIFGEFEWLTNEQVSNIITTNLVGTMTMTKMFLPMLRKFKGRIINVTSHCGLQPLPGLSVYSATKAGLLFWTDSLRQEVKKYGVNVINFIPGSFIMSSNILSKQSIYADEMVTNFTSEQTSFYSCFFSKYMNYLSIISNCQKTEDLDNTIIMAKFVAALLHENPYDIYKAEPLRYKIYHFLFKITPTFVRDWLVQKFIQMPQYDGCESIKQCGCCPSHNN